MSRATMTTTTLAAVALAAALPAGAAAATLQTDARCYQETGEVIISGSGFAPLSAVAITRDGTPLGTAQADAAGAFRNKIDTPELPREVRERRYVLSASDALSTATATYRASRIYAGFRPTRGNPATLRVRFGVYGFGLVRASSPVYLHYVRPDGRAARTVRLGTARGVCGRIVRTRRRHLFPFAAERGRWILQFDTRARYERATSRRRTPWVRKPVEILVVRP